MSSILRNLRYALRQLRRSPGFAFLAVVSLALGIGANTAMFTVAESVLFRPLPYANPDRLVDVSAWGGESTALFPGSITSIFAIARTVSPVSPRIRPTPVWCRSKALP